MTTVYPPAPELPTGRGPLGTPPPRGRPDLGALLSPLQPLFRARAAHRLAVLAYRGIEDRAAFGAQMDRLVRTARPVSLADVAEALSGGRPLPPHSVLVTLDDGHPSAVSHALPALAARRIPAVAFVVTSLIGTDEPLWWEEAEFLLTHGGRARSLPAGSPAELVQHLRRLPDPDRRRSLTELRVSAVRQAPRRPQLAREDLLALRDGGVDIGNHSEGHAQLSRCDDDTVRAEVVGAHRCLAGLLGTDPTAFAYPDGAADPRAAAVLRGLGYRAAFVEDQSLFDARRRPGTAPDAFRISRLRVDPGVSPRGFDALLSGLSAALPRSRRSA